MAMKLVSRAVAVSPAPRPSRTSGLDSTASEQLAGEIVAVALIPVVGIALRVENKLVVDAAAFARPALNDDSLSYIRHVVSELRCRAANIQKTITVTVALDPTMPLPSEGRKTCQGSTPQLPES